MCGVRRKNVVALGLPTTSGQCDWSVREDSTAANVAAVIDKIVKKLCAVDRIGLAIDTVQTDVSAVDEGISHHLSEIRCLVTRRTIAIVKTCKSPSRRDPRAKHQRRVKSATASDVIKIIV